MNNALDLSKENSLQDIEKETISKKKLIEETISKAKSLISQKKFSDGSKILENVIQESKSFSESYSSLIFNQASEILDYCQDFKNNKKKLIKIEDLIKEKKFSIAKNRLQDLIDEIENYIGDKVILNKEILSEGLILLKEKIKPFTGGYLSESAEDFMIDRELEKIAGEIKELNYDVPLENMYNFLLDFSQIIIDPHISKTDDSTEDEYTLKTSQGPMYFKIKEKDLNKKLVYDYDFLSSTYGEKGRVFMDFSEPTSGRVILKIKNEIQEISKENRNQSRITNLLGAYLKQYIDMNLGKIIAKQLQAIIYEKDFDDLTIGNYRILQAKFNALGKDIDKLKTKFFEIKAPLTLTSFDCSECGATLNITSNEEKFIICEHCDTPFLMEWQKK